MYFDGVCNLCNGVVDFLIQRNSDILFAPLQGEEAKRSLPEEYTSGNLSTVVFQVHGQIYDRSSAVLRVLMYLGGLWSLATVFFLIPKFLRDFLYELVARSRYRIFGKRSTCRLPTPEERARFLD